MRLTKNGVGNGLAFFIALFWFVHIRVVGDLFISELMIGLVGLFMIKKHGYKLYEPLPKKILFFGLLWLGSQVLTDLVRMSPVESLVKGWANIIFFLVDFSVLYMLIYKNQKRLILFITAFAIGGILRCFVEPGWGYEDEPWKFGFAFPTILLTIMLLSWLSHKRLITASMMQGLLLLLGMLSIYLNARSLGASLVLASFMLFISRQTLFYSIFLRRWSPGRMVGVFVTVVGFISIIAIAYQWTGDNKLLPEASQYKYELTKSVPYGVFGTLLIGRNEFLTSIPAVIDSPVIGHGSWPVDPKYSNYLYQINSVLKAGYNSDFLREIVESSYLIPTHSHLMQSWVWAGFLGALFWLVVLSIMGKSFILSIRFQHTLTPLLVFLSLMEVWDLLFSPFSSIMRIQWAWELVLTIMAFEMSRRMQRNKIEESVSVPIK
jgi:hypothetical protein